MSRKKITKNTAKPKKNIRESHSFPWRYCLLTLICGAFLVVGFFGAARQHFSSIDFGIKNSRLRKQVDELEAEQRRMLLNKEVVMSPGEIKKSAKKIGFVEMSASNIEVFRNNPEVQPKTAPAKKIIDLKSAGDKETSEQTKKQQVVSEKDVKKPEKTAEAKKDKPKTPTAKK